jgi:hypothetical protein
LEEEQDVLLKKIAKAEGREQSWYIRKGLDIILKKHRRVLPKKSKKQSK